MARMAYGAFIEIRRNTYGYFADIYGSFLKTAAFPRRVSGNIRGAKGLSANLIPRPLSKIK